MPILIVVCAACGFLLILELAFGWGVPQRSTVAAGTIFLRQPQTGSGFMMRLRIPRINVNAAIESVGLTSNGAMDVPSDPDHVGWYNLGPPPGAPGNAGFAGHVDWYRGRTAVFQHLNKLQKDDVLFIDTGTGKLLTFIVREIRVYQPTDYAPDVFQKSNGSHLNLVTCGGVWDPVRKIYSERLVVFTDAAAL